MDRKKFLSAIAVISTGAMVSSLLDACSTTVPAPVDVDFTIDINDPDFSALKNVGGFAYNEGIIIVHNAAGNFDAFSQACTHSGCTVNYDSGLQRFPCPCHGSVYSNSGNVINGPAVNPLKSYQTELNGDMLRVFD